MSEDTTEDDSNIDDNRQSVSIESLTSEVNLSGINTLGVTSPLKKGKKRQRNEDKWKRNIDKKLRNKGQLYESHCASKKMRKERQMKSPCKLKCSSKFNDENRKELFSGFWELGDIERQRQFNQILCRPFSPSIVIFAKVVLEIQETITMRFISF